MIQAVVMMSVFGTGVVCSLIGALKLQLARRLEINDAQVGYLISTLMFASLLAILALGPIVDTFGHKPLAVLGFVLAAASVFSLGSAKSYLFALIACTVLGIGGMCLNVVGNTLLPIVLFNGKNPPAALNLGNAFYGLGAFITPFLAGITLKRLGYGATKNIIAAILLIPLAFAGISLFPLHQGAFVFSELYGVLTDQAVIITSIAFFCYLGLEVSLTGWITTYGSSLDFSEERANLMLSLFWINLITGRLIAAGTIGMASGPRVIVVLSLVAALTIGLMVTIRSRIAGLVFVIVTGLVLGPIFPTIVSIALSIAGTSVRASTFSVVFAGGLLGASIIPMIIGLYAKGRSIREALKIGVGAALLLSVMALLLCTL